jgi:hypothetical protein
MAHDTKNRESDQPKKVNIVLEDTVKGAVTQDLFHHQNPR